MPSELFMEKYVAGQEPICFDLMSEKKERVDPVGFPRISIYLFYYISIPSKMKFLISKCVISLLAYNFFLFTLMSILIEDKV